MSGIKVSEEFFKKFGKKFPPESYLTREGEEGKTMFLIHTGKVAITKNTPAGEKILAVLCDGDFFGEMAIMGLQDKRAASCKTVAETTVLELNREAFEGIIRRSPEIGIGVIKTLTERIRDANGRTAALIHRDDRIRLATYTNYLVMEKGVPAGLNQPGRCAVFRPKEVGTSLGVAIEAVQTFLGLAKRARIIGQNGEWIWVPYPNYLLPFGEYLVAHS